MKKKIISVVLVMTMVFALLAVSASADPAPEPIESVSLMGIPEKLYYGDDIAKIIEGIQIPGDANYEVYEVTVIDMTSSFPATKTSGTINVTGRWDLRIKLIAEDGFNFKTKETYGNLFDVTVTSNDDASASMISVFKIEDVSVFKIEDNVITPIDEHVPANGISFAFTYTIENTTPNPNKPTPDFDFDFDGLLAKILELIGWKKVTDDIKTVSILSIIFKLIEEIVAKLAAYIKN